MYWRFIGASVTGCRTHNESPTWYIAFCAWCDRGILIITIRLCPFNPIPTEFRIHKSITIFIRTESGFAILLDGCIYRKCGCPGGCQVFSWTRTQEESLLWRLLTVCVDAIWCGRNGSIVHTRLSPIICCGRRCCRCICRRCFRSI